MKLEMAVLYSDGGPEGYWELATVEIPEANRGNSYHELDLLGRTCIYADETFSECAGTYLFNERVDELEDDDGEPEFSVKEWFKQHPDGGGS